MRSLGALALFGSLVLANAAFGQALTEHAAAAAGATIGTAAGKPISNALTNIFGNVDHATATAAASKDKTTNTAPKTAEKEAPLPAGAALSGGSAPAFTPSPSAPVRPSASVSRRRSTAARPVAAPYYPPEVVTEPPRKEPTPDELAAIRIGMTSRELEAALGTPESHVISPDDDGHLRESCQYWAQGKQLGTVRLDNGQVIRVDLFIRN